MFKRKFFNIIITFLMITSMTLGGLQPALAQGQNPPSNQANGGNLHGRPTPAERQAAAKRLQEAQKKAGITTPKPAVMDFGGTPDYFGTTPNYANSPLPSVTGHVVSGGIRKFVDSLPQLGPTGVNDLGQYLPVAVADTTTYPGSDYYEIGLVQYVQKMHADLPATLLRGYVQIDPGVHSCTGALALHYIDLNGVVGAPILDSGGLQVCSKAPPQYLGPIIVSKSYDPTKAAGVAGNGQPTRIKFTNYLPLGSGGNLFIPVDTTAMGAGMGPSGQVTGIAISAGGTGYTLPPVVTISGGGSPVVNATAVATILNGVVNTLHITNPGEGYTSAPVVNITPAAGDTTGTGAAATLSWIGASAGTYTENRATLHLHGGVTPWISDGTPHQWTTPANETTSYPEGVSVENVPDMPDPGAGSLTFFYSNQQSARLMFYHDHAYGITRLNVYAGEAAGYLLTDQTEQDLINAKILPDLGIPLVIQDKTFVPPAPQLAAQDPTWDPTKWGGTGSLWFPHVYMPNQNPFDMEGVNAMGRWDYGPWFWPPYTGIQYGPVANPLSGTTSLEGPVNPGTPNPSMVPEGFMDTPLVNGTAYPTLTVQPKLYRFRILNAANDRMWNLQLYKATTIVSHLTITNPGGGYTDAPKVTIKNAAGDTKGTGATAIATVDTDPTSPTFGQLIGLDLWTVGSGYTKAPIVTIAASPTGKRAKATAAIYTGTSEVGMVPFNSEQNNITPFPSSWYTPGNPFTLDDRNGGVPDPTKRGPAFVQIGSEGGVMVSPTIINSQPVNYVYNRRDITVLNVAQKALMLGPAERADVVVDFSKFAGKTLILYNDAPAPMPASDPRNDYFTGDPDLTSSGGAPSTLPGYGPNTRTIMKIVVSGAGGTGQADAYNKANYAALQSAIPAAFKNTQPAPVVPEAAYNAAYGANYTNTYVRITDTTIPFTPAGQTTPITMDLGPKTIQELFTVDYGRMNATLGVEIPKTSNTIQTTIPFGYIDPATELLLGTDQATPIGTAADGSQVWKITHNGVDSHAIHFHLFNVQVINRVGWDGAIRPPDANEIGWKDTVRMSPLEDVIVALRPLVPQNLPFLVPNSYRLMDVTRPIGSTMGFFGTDPLGNPASLSNQLVNYGWEYVWHCHLLGHEENDMMRPIMVVNPPNGPNPAPTNLTAVAQAGPQILLNWTLSTSTNVTNYIVQRANDAAFTTNLTSIKLGLVATYTDSAILPFTDYYYRVLATNVVGGVVGVAAFPSMQADSTPSNTAFVLAPPAVPTTLNTSLVDGGIKLTWTDNATNETGFDIVRSTDNITYNPLISTGANAGTGPVTYTDFTTAPSSNYYYGVRATNTVGQSAYIYSTLLTTSAAPNAADTLTAAIQTGPQVLLTWNDNATDETGFFIERSIGAGSFTLLTTAPAHTGTGSTTYSDASILPATTYHYRVTAVALGSRSAPTNTADAVVPAIPLAPTGLTAAAQAGPQVLLSWTNNANNQSGFNIQRSDNGGAFVALPVSPLLDTSAPGTITFTDTTVTLGNSYAYRVNAMNVAGASVWATSASVVVPTIPAAPTGLTLALVNGGIQLTWTDNATNETSFDILRTSNGWVSYQALISIPANPGTGSVTYTDLTITALSNYSYAVAATNTSGQSAFTYSPGLATPAGPNGAPTGLTAVLQAGPKVHLAWVDHATNETGFSIERSINGGAFAILTTVGPHASTGNVAINDTTVLGGNSYAYRVRAFKLGSNSAYSNTASVVLVAVPAAPTGLTVAVHPNQPRMILNWTDNATTETSFVLERSNNGGAFNALVTFAAHTGTGAMTYTDTTATAAGHTYTYRIQAVNAGGNSAYSNTASQTAGAPAVPSNFIVFYTKGSPTDVANLSWVNVATNATSLKLTRATNAAFTTNVVNTTLSASATFSLQSGLTPGKTYYFRIWTSNGYGSSAYALVNAIAP